AGDITDGGVPFTINLSDNGAGHTAGSLILIAGFNFAPSTLGATAGPDTTIYTLTTASSGQINLANTLIDLHGQRSGGNLFAFANGPILLNQTDVHGVTGDGGAVIAIGQGITVNGSIN